MEAPNCEIPGFRNTKRDYAEIGAVVLILAGLYFLLKQFDVLPKNLGITENMNYGMAFLLGLVAAVSTCLAVTGGLLVGFAAKYNEKFPNLTGFQKLKPHLWFNAGRVISYTVLGGAVGALGSLFTFSARANGILTVIASVVMIALGFQLLKIFPSLSFLMPSMPKWIGHKLFAVSEESGGTSKRAHGVAFALGGGTFFLPCGFTQALQLYVLSKGDASTGALTMLAFSLGTLPALLSLSLVSSFARGAFQRYFVKFAGALVILMGFFNVGSGLALAGADINLASIFQVGSKTEDAEKSNVELVNGKQVARMTVSGLDYYPHRFTVEKGVPVEWRIDGRKGVGCASVISVPDLGLMEYLPRDKIKVITFTPQEEGEIRFSCTMGMTTWGSAFIVRS